MFHEQMQILDTLLAEIDQSADPATRSRLTEIAATLMDLHRSALERMLQHLAKSPAADSLTHTIATDPAISGVLVLHGLHPVDTETRVRQALAKCAPYIGSHGGHVELLGVGGEGVVRLRLEGSCHGCPSSRITLRSSIEQEIYAAAPEVSGIEVEGLVDEEPDASFRAHAGASSFVPLENLSIHGAT